MPKCFELSKFCLFSESKQELAIVFVLILGFVRFGLYGVGSCYSNQP